MAVRVPLERVPLKTSPKPPEPMRLCLEKLLVAFVISLMVKILADLPLLLSAFNMSCALFLLLIWAAFCLWYRKTVAVIKIPAIMAAIANAKPVMTCS